jgi:MFS family permease
MITPPRAAVRRLALGRVISVTGSLAATTALAFTLYERTGSAAWIAGTMVLTWGLTGMFGPVAGAIGDRFDRRLVMIWSDVGPAVCWAVMALFDAPVALLAIAFVGPCSRCRSSRRPELRSRTWPVRRTSRGRTASWR